MVREFFRGVGILLRGFGWWRRRPGVLALGLVPAAIVGAALLGVLIALGFFVDEFADAVTPFADTWPELWSTVLRVAVGTAMFGAALVLCVVSFTALTLLVGEPFYDRIWRTVERDLSGSVPDLPYGFWRAVGDSGSLILRGVLVAIAAGLLGLIPVVGGATGLIVGTALAGWLIADELSSRALTARGLDAGARRALLRGHRARSLGFGVAVQLFFLLPLGAVAVMPAAVAGSTMLARGLVGETTKPAQTALASSRPAAQPPASSPDHSPTV